VFLCIFFEKVKTLLCPIVYSATVTFLYTFTPLKPISSEYSILIWIVPYIFFVLILQIYKVEKA
jgi:hypothetical protein